MFLLLLKKINRDVLIVEECDPWVKGAFDVDGLGEGLVYYPVDGSEKEGAVERDQVTTLLFKAKGEKHEVVRQPKPAQLEPEVLKSIDAFVEMFVTPGRLEQGLREGCDSVLEMKSLSSFLKWFGQDVKKESQDELLASGLEWKLVSKPVVTAARVWFVEKIKSSDD